MAGLYFIRKLFPSYSPIDKGPELPGLPYPPPGGASDPNDIREIPLAIQDRVFEQSSKLWYPVAELTNGVALPQGEQPPVWIPEFLFDLPPADNPMMMVVNGRTWPKQVSGCQRRSWSGVGNEDPEDVCLVLWGGEERDQRSFLVAGALAVT
jgi:hypothetical protein